MSSRTEKTEESKWTFIVFASKQMAWKEIQKPSWDRDIGPQKLAVNILPVQWRLKGRASSYYEDDKNVTDLHIWLWKTVVLHAL